MARELRVYDGFSEADRADRAPYAAMTPDERLALVLELSARERGDDEEASARRERVLGAVALEDG